MRVAFSSLVRSSFIAASICVSALAAGAAELPYSKPAFEAAIAGGKPVIVDFAAGWCPTCKAQKPLVDSLLKEPKREQLTLLKADFDTEDALKKQLGVAMQSTFVVFKGGKEVGRSTGQTDRAALATLFDKAL
jgi:thioredoxin 1